MCPWLKFILAGETSGGEVAEKRLERAVRHRPAERPRDRARVDAVPRELLHIGRPPAEDEDLVAGARVDTARSCVYLSLLFKKLNL